MVRSENLVQLIKRILYGSRGEPYTINNVKLFFQAGSRPTRMKYINSKNETVRNDVLQLQFFGKVLKPDSVFWDIGAHYGTYSLMASAYLRNDNSIFAFEPDEKAVLILKKNLGFNGLQSRVKVFESAVSSQSGWMNFDMQDGNSNSHLITKEGVVNKGLLNKIKTVTLDEMIKSTPKPDLIKVDTEGAELDIIKGAERVLNDPSITFICELHPFAWDWYTQVSWEDFKSTLKKYNREIKPLDPLKSVKDLPYYGTVIF